MKIETITEEDTKDWKHQAWELFKRNKFSFITILTFYSIALTIVMMFFGAYNNKILNYVSVFICQFIIVALITNIVVQAKESNHSNPTIGPLTFISILLRDYKRIFRLFLYYALFIVLAVAIGDIISWIFSSDETIKKTTEAVNELPKIIEYIFIVAGISIIIASKAFNAYVFADVSKGFFAIPLILFFDLDVKEALIKSREGIEKNQLIWFLFMMKMLLFGIISIVIPILGFVFLLYFSLIMYIAFRHIYMGEKLNEKAKVKVEEIDALPEGT